MLKSLSDILDPKGNPSSADVVDFLKLVRDWKLIVGDSLARHTLPIKFKNQILTVATKHSAFAQQLSFMGETIKRKIGAHLPQFKDKIQKINFYHSEDSFQE